MPVTHPDSTYWTGSLCPKEIGLLIVSLSVSWCFRLHICHACKHAFYLPSPNSVQGQWKHAVWIHAALSCYLAVRFSGPLNNWNVLLCLSTITHQRPLKPHEPAKEEGACVSALSFYFTMGRIMLFVLCGLYEWVNFGVWDSVYFWPSKRSLFNRKWPISLQNGTRYSVMK